MSTEFRLKKLRGSGGYVLASVTDSQQRKGNLGGPDLFLAPIGRLDAEKITKHFCNTCEKEFAGPPKIEFENPNEEVAENLILAERGQYSCNSCNASIAEYREFKKPDEAGEVGSAKPLEPENTEVTEPAAPQMTEPAAPQMTEPAAPQMTEPAAPQMTEPAAEVAEPAAPQETVTRSNQTTSVTSIEGKSVFDEDANKIGTAKQVGIDSTQSMVLVITREDGTIDNISWNDIKKIGQIVLLGSSKTIPGRCPSCGFVNKEGSKFCEECGTKI